MLFRSASAVILSKGASEVAPNYNMIAALQEDYTRLRIFGKLPSRAGRRLGVVLTYGPTDADMTQLRDKAKALAAKVL